MNIVRELGAITLHVKSESLLVVNQMNEEFTATDSKMVAYLKIAKKKSEYFKTFSIEQIPRDQNSQVMFP